MTERLPLTPFLEQVHDKLFAEFPLWQDAAGRALGRVFKNELSSDWLPVRDEGGRVIGQAAITAVHDSAGAAIPVDALFRLLRDDGLARLDRFCRTLHVLNRTAGDLPLFLAIHPLLPRSVRTEHGLVFQRILEFLGIDAAQVVITLPAAVVQDAALLERVTGNYRNHGYGVAWMAGGPRPGSVALAPDWWIQPQQQEWHASRSANSDI